MDHINLWTIQSKGELNLQKYKLSARVTCGFRLQLANLTNVLCYHYYSKNFKKIINFKRFSRHSSISEAFLGGLSLERPSREPLSSLKDTVLRNSLNYDPLRMSQFTFEIFVQKSKTNNPRRR